MINKIRLLALLLLSLSSIRGFSQPMVLTYNDAIDIALDRGYTIKSYENSRAMTRFLYEYYKAQFKPRLDFDIFTPSWSESVQTIYQADGLPVYNSSGSLKAGGNLQFMYVLPTGGDLSLSANTYFENQETVLTLQDNKSLKNSLVYNRFAISFSQPIFTKNRLKEDLKEAELEFEKSTATYERGQMDIIYDVTSGFYSLYRATRLMEIAKESLKNSEEALRVAKLQSESGRIPEGDLMTAELDVAQDVADLSSTIGDLEREKDIFKQLIGIDLTEEISVLVEFDTELILIDREIAIREALNNRLELKEAELDIDLQGIEVDKAKRERELSGNISGFYDLTGVSTIEDGSLSEFYSSSIENMDTRPPNRGVQLTLSYPISDWGRGRARVNQAETDLRNRHLSLENKKISVIREVREIIRNVEESQKRLVIHEKNIELAQRSYRIFTIKFENGDISNQDLAIERERLSSIQLNYLDAYIENRLSLANLKRKTMWDFKSNRSYRIDWKE